MPATFRTSVSALGGSSVTSHTLIRPAGVLNTDYCIVIAINGDAKGDPATPSGFTALIPPSNNNVAGGRAGIYGKTIGAGTSILIDWPAAAGTTGNNTAVMALFFDGFGAVDAVSPLVMPVAASVIGTAPSVTTTGPDRLMLTIGLNKGGGSGYASTAALSPDATMIATCYGIGTYYPSIVVGEFDQAVAGATRAQTITWDYSTTSQAGGTISLEGMAVSTVPPSSLLVRNDSHGWDPASILTRSGGAWV